MRYPLIDGQGNYGSVTAIRPRRCGTPKRAWRKISEESSPISKKRRWTSFPTSTRRAKSRRAALEDSEIFVVNGASGIAVGMATNIPPHNLGEIMTHGSADREAGNDTQGNHEAGAGPDFQRRDISGSDGIVAAYKTGRGSFTMRAKAAIETSARTARTSSLPRFRTRSTSPA